MPETEEPASAVVAKVPRRSPAAVLCKEKTSAPGKKLVQARLPFKRLNPVPKEKESSVSDVKKAKTFQNASRQNSLLKLDKSLDSLENDCQLDAEMVSPPPKIINGIGPLDQFLKRRKDIPASPAVTIDLTEDSNSAQFDQGSSAVPNFNVPKEATARTEKKVKNPSKPVVSCQNDTVPMETEVVGQKTGAAVDGDCLDRVRSCSPGVLSDGEGLTMSQEERALIFQGKKPVVVLQDIMISKPFFLGPREGIVLAEEDKQEKEEVSSPEVELVGQVLSTSAAGSPVAGSSSEAGVSPTAENGQENNNRISPSSLTTPVRQITPKISKPSSEKRRRREQDERRKKLQAEKEEKDRLKEEAKNAKERAKEEAKKKKDEEKELKDKERKEKRDKEEQEKKEKKEKEEKEKAEKLRMKEEKRKEKQEALDAKLEEKRKKEEEKRVKEEEKRIKAGKSEITRFFQKPKTQNAPKIFAGSCGKFAPFEIKKNMALAPLCRVDFDTVASENLDELMQTQMSEVSYLKELKCRKPRKCRRTVVSHHIVPANSDVIVVENGETDDVQDMPDDPLESELLMEDSGAKDSVPERKQFGRMKLLQFSENHRPAYWGTWNKQSDVIHPRKPWLKDDKNLDYEIDSDEEWEEEEPGESLSHSEGDDDDEAADDDEDDDGFFVPHGYLSDDEGAAEEELQDPENQKVRQKLKAKEWDELVSEGKKFRVLKPIVIGCIWENSGASRELKALQRFATCILESVLAEEELAQEKCEKRNHKDQQILEKLLPLLHGNFNASKVIIQEFQECCRRGLLSDRSGTDNLESNGTSPSSPNTSRPHTPTASENIAIPSKARLKRIISENSTYEKRPDFRMCWYVHAEVLKKFDQEALPVPCQWTYLTQVNSAVREESSTSPGTQVTQNSPASVKRKSSGSMSITKFMKRPKESKKIGVAETDGFQADTEDEDDDDCVVVNVQSSKDSSSPSSKLIGVSVESVPITSPKICISNLPAVKKSEHDHSMEIIHSKAAVENTNSETEMETAPTDCCMLSNNSETKTPPITDIASCLNSPMDIASSEDTVFTQDDKTVRSGKATTVCAKGTMEAATSIGVAALEQDSVETTIEAPGPTVSINCVLETVPTTGAMISIPNKA